jgi:hypothetical protein
MIIDFNQKITDIDGKTIYINQLPLFQDNGQPYIINNRPATTDGDLLTLGLASVIALQNNYPDEQGLNPEQKLSRMKTALKIHKNPDPVELTVEEVAEIKKTVNKQFGTLVYFRVNQLIEDNK